MFLLKNLYLPQQVNGVALWGLLMLSGASSAQLVIKPSASPAPAPITAPAVATPGTPAARPAQRIVTLDRIVAVVNNEVITRSALTERVNRARSQLARQGTAAPPLADLERQLLERMITDSAVIQFGRENGLRIDDVELDRAIERIAQDNQMVTAQLRAALEKDGIPYARFREDIRDQIHIARLREREVTDKIVVTESEIDNLLAAAQPGTTADEYNVSHILVRVPENASPQQVQERQARAQQALAQLKAGTDFRQVAASFSEAPDALQGGSMGWRESARLPTLFADALVSMKAGDLSAVLRSPNGFHVLKLMERRGGNQQTAVVQQTQARHILIKVSEIVSESEGRNRLLNLKERIENKGDFAQLARANSEDTSASRGGDLGWISPGDTVPEFERAMDALKPGETSAPVRSPFGWHLIQVVARRSSDMTNERKRLAARQTLREKKGEEAFEEWVRQTRDRAYVEIRLDER